MDMNEIRRTRLRKLIDEHFGGVVLRLAERLQKKPPQVHRWLAENGQGIHETSAREIERLCHMPTGWLDGNPVAQIAAEQRATYAAADSIETRALDLAADAQAIAAAWLRLPEHRRQRLLAQIVAEARAAGHTTTAEQITGNDPDMRDNPPRHIIPGSGFSAVSAPAKSEQKKSPGGKPGDGK